MIQQFPGQKPNEQVKVLVRPHWLVLLRPTAAILFLAIIPAVVLVVLSANEVEPFSGLGLAITAVTVPAYYLTLITWFFIAWVDYYLDVGIVTDQRVIDIDQRGLFRRNVAELECQMVQDVNADKSGILQTVFDFGDVTVQTAGERPNFVFHAVPHPDQIVDRIGEAITDARKQEGGAAEKLHEAASKFEEAADKVAEQGAAPKTQHAEQPSPTQPDSAGQASGGNHPGPSPAEQPVAAPAATSGGSTPPSEPPHSAQQTGTPSAAPAQPAQDLPRQYER